MLYLCNNTIMTYSEVISIYNKHYIDKMPFDTFLFNKSIKKLN